MNSELFSNIILPVVIGLIMFNLGLSLKVRDFKNILVYPRAVIIGLICQMILLPLIAFGIAILSDLPAAIKIGIILIAACPGGATSNLITYWLKGDVALSISLTSVNSVLILFSIPSITYLALTFFNDDGSLIYLPFFKTTLKILYMILLPTLAGIIIHKYWKILANNIEKYLKYITTILLALVFTVTILLNKSQNSISISDYLSIAPYAFALNLLGMFVGLLAGYFTKLNTRQIITLIIEVGIQNSALAITIATSKAFLSNPQMALPAVVYGMFTFFNALVFGWVAKRWFMRNVE